MRRRILVVDDDPGMLHAMQRILSSGYELACADGAAEAERLLESHRPDLAILDIRMPDVDGFDLMGRLKTARPDLDVILMTGSADEADQKLLRSIRERAFYFIRKPFDREVLQTLVERCLEQRRLTEANREHLRRLENVLAEARAFQAGMLPGPQARFGKLQLAARYVPCEQLCGDFYDYVAHGAGGAAFIIADVSGHGASAAMLTGVVKSAFRSCSRERFEPSSVVERIWTGVRAFGANRFVSLFCGRVDTREGRLDYVNAGHPPAVVWGGSEETVLLGSTGPIVSPVWDDPVWEQRTGAFGEGRRLLVYTDGITEAFGPDDMFGRERLTAVVDGHREGGVELLDAVLESVETFMGGRRLEDDLTLLSLAAMA